MALCTITLRQASRLGGFAKPWVAVITGASPKYRFDRTFVEPTSTVHGGEWIFDLEDGYYELCNRNSKGRERRWFVRIESGREQSIDRADLESAFPVAPTDPPEDRSEEPVAELRSAIGDERKEDLPGDTFRVGELRVIGGKLHQITKVGVSDFWSEDRCHDEDEFWRLDCLGWYTTVTVRPVARQDGDPPTAALDDDDIEIIG